MDIRDDKTDYSEYSDQELAEALEDYDFFIDHLQNDIAMARRSLNRYMENREQVIDLIKQRAQRNKGWKK